VLILGAGPGLGEPLRTAGITVDTVVADATAS
jgi:hypothetical protein